MVVKKMLELVKAKIAAYNHIKHCGSMLANGVFRMLGLTKNPMFQAGLIFTLKCAAIAVAILYVTWGFFCFALSLPNPLRALTIWGYLFVLCIAAQAVNPQGRC